jgi:hypothetical protein
MAVRWESSSLYLFPAPLREGKRGETALLQTSDFYNFYLDISLIVIYFDLLDGYARSKVP